MEEKIRNDLIAAFDELNVLTLASFYLSEEDDIQERIKQIIGDVLSMLIKAYLKGVEHAILMLRTDFEVDTDKMNQAIYRKIDGRDFTDRIEEYVLRGNFSAFQVLVETEYHRIYNNAIYDCFVDFSENGDFGVVKVWRTMGDDRVRETHAYLEGVAVDLEDEFYTLDGDHAPYPGGFQKAENNVNCRCHIEKPNQELSD